MNKVGEHMFRKYDKQRIAVLLFAVVLLASFYVDNLSLINHYWYERTESWEESVAFFLSFSFYFFHDSHSIFWINSTYFIALVLLALCKRASNFTGKTPFISLITMHVLYLMVLLFYLFLPPLSYHNYNQFVGLLPSSPWIMWLISVVSCIPMILISLWKIRTKHAAPLSTDHDSEVRSVIAASDNKGFLCYWGFVTLGITLLILCLFFPLRPLYDPFHYPPEFRRLTWRVFFGSSVPVVLILLLLRIKKKTAGPLSTIHDSEVQSIIIPSDNKGLVRSWVFAALGITLLGVMHYVFFEHFSNYELNDSWNTKMEILLSDYGRGIFPYGMYLGSILSVVFIKKPTNSQGKIPIYCFLSLIALHWLDFYHYRIIRLAAWYISSPDQAALIKISLAFSVRAVILLLASYIPIVTILLLKTIPKRADAAKKLPSRALILIIGMSALLVSASIVMKTLWVSEREKAAKSIPTISSGTDEGFSSWTGEGFEQLIPPREFLAR